MNYWFYSTEIFVILIDKSLRAGMVFVIIIQLFFSLLATFSLYKLATHLFSEKTGLACVALFLLNYPFHAFNTFAQTESLYYSLSIIVSSYLLRLPSLRIKNILIISIALLIITFTRPTGILFVPPVALYLWLRFGKSIRSAPIIITGTVLSILFIIVLNTAISSGGQLDFMLPFKTNQIICGVSLETYNNMKTTERGNSIYGVFYYVTHNFSHFSNLAAQKTIAFFGLTRTYFSTGHNLFLVLFFYPLYLLIILSSKSWIKNNLHTFVYLCTVLLITWATTLLTCDDWHNRFFLAISPYAILLSLPAVNKIIYFISSGTFSRTRY